MSEVIRGKTASPESATRAAQVTDDGMPARISAYCEHYQAVIELIGRRWVGSILRALMSHGSLRFNELLALIPGISDRLLTERLRDLCREGLVERAPAPGLSAIAVQYRLTEAGRDLEGVVRSVSAWTHRWRAVLEG
jgi:DNA-binding HxlR family transcriptional regulator